MARTSEKPGARASAARSRTVRIPRRRPGLTLESLRTLQTRRGVWMLLSAVGFVVLTWLVALAVHERPLVAAGRTALVTRVVRVPIAIEDESATEAARQEARLRTPRIYVAREAALGEIRSSLESLPRTLASVRSVDEVDPGIVRQFAIDEERLEAIRAAAVDGRPGEQWLERIERLMQLLQSTPLLDEQTWQRESQEGLRGEKWLSLRAADRTLRVSDNAAVNVGDAEALRERSRRLAERAGFEGPLADVVVARLTRSSQPGQPPQPTFRFDESETRKAQERAARAVQPVERVIPEGTVLFRRGERVAPTQYERHLAEEREYAAQRPVREVWPVRLGLLAAITAVALGAGGYVAQFVPGVRRSASRVAWLSGMATAAVALAAIATASNPSFLALTAVAPTVLFAVLLSIAYDQRTALALGIGHAALVTLVLGLPIWMFVVLSVGVGVAVWMLPDIRDRSTLVRMGMASGAALAGAMFCVSLVSRPVAPGAGQELVIDSLLSGFAGLLVAGLTTFILPWIERRFNITTGMTLMELRDPKQPLLRELQQRAPGTYNHSLNVASIAEDAADSIGARSLLTYVGALYHDIGKMNKPEYFVENQSGGPSKHDKLSPAMSLLVIVGHVKDGVELAREHGLPRPLHHFIEAHHGTTLVEFFFHRAKDQAAGESPEEFDYRYPGPKPQTKEVAILMLADAVESATRSLKEPTPSRIDALVREIANKRLQDGQFDECNLTLRELHTIVATISRSVASIYHGRIAYPSGEKREPAPRPAQPQGA